MAKTLGLDIGTNSIGWATIDTDRNQQIESGAKIFQNNTVGNRIVRRNDRRNYNRLTSNVKQKIEKKQISQSSLVIFCLLTFIILTGILAVTNSINWLNLSLTILAVLLTMTYSKEK